jgi:hypothetical protein
VARAGEWFLRSGIQTPEGGVARYYRADLGRNQSISTEITGYAASTFALLEQWERARATARFLTGAWDRAARAMPFEIEPPRFSYFFDCGIVVRGLLAVWRATGDDEFLECARLVGQSMISERRMGRSTPS